MRLIERFFGSFDDTALGPAGLHDEQHPVDHVADDPRIGHRDDRRRVDNDKIKLLAHR
ncbi:hypothetical protein D3C83_279900 [compost metagenome]